jgi:drug/metabolite transporter (DMT)-like permease
METVFGTVLGLLVRHRWPTLIEGIGMTVLLAGVGVTIQIVHGHRDSVGAEMA